MSAFNGVKVFSATMVADRMVLGEKVTEWLARNPKLEVTEMLVTQSSDHAFHCVAITVFYVDHDHVARTLPPTRRLAFISKHGDSPVEEVPAKCDHPPHRLGTNGSLRRNQRVCLNCGATVTVGKAAS